MGILNVTPDSFYDGGRYEGTQEALKQAERMLKEGADIIDVGGESTRPGAEPVTAEEEMRRVLPVIERLKRDFAATVSIDTYKAPVARAALERGADMLNDISAVRFDPDMPPVLLERPCPLVLMHMKGTPRDMQRSPYYDDVVAEVKGFFRERIRYLTSLGISPTRFILDPGIGFGKRLEDNLALIAALEDLAPDGLPLLVGASRKSLIGAVLSTPEGSPPLAPEERLEGTLAITALSVWKGARIIRVHDVKENRRVARMIEAIKNQAPGAQKGRSASGSG